MGIHNLSSVADAVGAHPEVLVKQGVSAAQCTTFAIGGSIETLAEPQSNVGLSHVLHVAQSEGQSYRVLGAGSNLLVADEGLPGVTIRLGRGFRYVNSLSAVRFEVGGAMSLMSLSRELSDAGLSGLEFAGGIPASVGGAVRMNAGAHGSELANCLDAVSVMLPDQRILRLDSAELGFSYRHSVLPEGAIVLKAEITLTQSSKESCSALRRKYLAERKEHQPLTAPSAGSVFRNPDSAKSAGFLIEACGLKGRSVGGAQVSLMHGNWIVNEERRATASDVLGLIDLCQRSVHQKFGIALNPEVISWR